MTGRDDGMGIISAPQEEEKPSERPDPAQSDQALAAGERLVAVR